MEEEEKKMTDYDSIIAMLTKIGMPYSIQFPDKNLKSIVTQQGIHFDFGPDGSLMGLYSA